MAGTTGFDPEAWCPDCAFYKLRRTPGANATIIDTVIGHLVIWLIWSIEIDHPLTTH
jgi:hypothetical protein